MNINVKCEGEYAIVRFFEHFQLGVKKDIGDHEKNFIEKVGDAGLWFVEELPRKIYRALADPKVATIVVAALGIGFVSLVFYPITSFLAIKAVILALPAIPFWAAKFSIYISIVGLIVSAATRAMGRFINTELMNQFYNWKLNNITNNDVKNISNNIENINNEINKNDETIKADN